MEEYTYRNNVIIRGKITGIERKKECVKFFISCRKNTQRKHWEKGKLIKERTKHPERHPEWHNTVMVKFFDDMADKYEKEFHVGDFVTTSGVVQKVIDRYNWQNYVNVWGFNMFPAEPYHDANSVSLQGIIEDSAKITDGYIIVNLKTAVTHKRKSLRPGSEFEYFEDVYRSTTPIGIRCPGNANEMLKKCTKGTWISLEGFVFGKKVNKKDKNTGADIQIRAQRVVTYAKRIQVIGQVQRIMR